MDDINCPEVLKGLLAQRMRLMNRIASGIVEVDQPQMGRTQYQVTPDLHSSLRMLDEQIAAMAAVCGVTVPGLTGRKKRQPLYPTVQEV